jgi:hypothetical protein
MNSTPPADKPGLRTTEFWLTLLAALFASC